MLRPLPRLALSCALLTLLALIVGTGASDPFDTAVLAALLPMRALAADAVASAVTLLGDPVIDGILAIGLAFSLSRREGAIGLTPLLLFVGVAVAQLLKPVVFEPGPPSEYIRDAVITPALSHLSPYTFPEGHTMRVVFLAQVLGRRLPRARLPLYALAVLVAFGRVYLAAGWASDVLGGALLALALGASADLLRERAR